MDKQFWIDQLSKGEVLRLPRKPEPRKVYDTVVFDCSFQSPSQLTKLKKKLHKDVRVLIVAPSEDSPTKFPEEAGKVWKEKVLRKIIVKLTKFLKLKQKLFYKCIPELNKNYVYYYIALVR